MYSAFEDLCPDARIWIYAAPRLFSQEECDSLNAELKRFSEEWTAHKRPVKTFAGIVNSAFILMAADDSINEVSGCSIDSSVKFIKSLGTRLNMDFFDRHRVTYKIGSEIKITSLTKFQEMVRDGVLSPETPVFNTWISSKILYNFSFEISYKNSPLSRMDALQSFNVPGL